MTNLSLKEIRTRGYFIQATKEILKGEGSRALSVRNIAERAGYSYATLYNYFKDLTELISLSLLEFKDECREVVTKSIRQSEPGKEEIKAIVVSYINYFVQYPGVFDLFYLEKLASTDVSNQVASFLDDLCDEDWTFLIDNCTYSSENAEILRNTVNYTTIGLLTSYLKRGQPQNYTDFIQEINDTLDLVLR